MACLHFKYAFIDIVIHVLTTLWMASEVSGDIFVRDIIKNRTVNKFTDAQASFGDDFPPDGLKGWIVHASPDQYACSPVNYPPVNETKCNETVCKYILLVARGGNCQFSDKILAAQNADYDAAIVYNYPGNNSEVEMQSCSNGSYVKIPSTFVGYTSGMELWMYNYTHRRFVIKIMEDRPIILPKFLWSFLLAMTLCILVALLFLLIKLGRDRASKKMNRLSRKHLKKIPVRKFKKGDYYDTCAICLDEYEEGEKIRVLPCDHVYHMKCIDPWLTKNKKTCPVCKRRVIPGKDGDSESEAEEGRATTEDSENTPLLRGASPGNPSIQSHGSIGEAENSSSFVHGGRDGNLIDSDVEHGAVGGEGISDRRPTLLTMAASCTDNIQEKDERRGSNNERKKKKKEGRRSEDDGGSESRAEQRERRRLRKEKRKQKNENRQKKEVSVERKEEEGVENEGDEQHKIVDDDVNEAFAQSEDAPTTDVQEIAHDNHGFSDDTQVAGPSTAPQRHKLNNVV